jgi:hypothetical protein
MTRRRCQRPRWETDQGPPTPRTTPHQFRRLWAYDMRAAKSPFVDQAQQERAHSPWGQQLSPAFGLAEARQINGDKSRGLSKAGPDRVPCKEALGPRVEKQDRLIPSRIGLGVPDNEAVGRALPRVHVGHRAASFLAHLTDPRFVRDAELPGQCAPQRPPRHHLIASYLPRRAVDTSSRRPATSPSGGPVEPASATRATPG